MLNVMQNFYLYIQKIYQHSDDFMKALKQTYDIDGMIDLHAKYLVKLKTNYFQQNTFTQTLFEILNMAVKFCDLWRRDITDTKRETIAQFDDDLNRYLKFLTNLLSMALKRNQLLQMQPLIGMLIS
jgi:hypothetical protein